MRKDFELLLDEMEKAIAGIDPGSSGIVGYAQAIELIREKILKLRVLSRKSLTTRVAEIDFFRHIWPLFYGKLFLYIKMHHYEMDKLALPSDLAQGLIKQEERPIARFFRENAEFCLYYRSGSPVIDDLFTRSHSMGRTFDEMSMVIDPEGGTVASYRAAWCLAYGEYKTFLGKELERLLNPTVGKGRRYEWMEGKTAAVELIKAQVEAGSIKIDGKPASAVQLRADFEDRFGQDLKEFDKLLYASDTRKKDPTPYLSKLVNAFIGRKERLRK